MTNISVITINLNNAEGLDKTLQSISKQRIGSYESIVVDGGSTDNSCDIIHKYHGLVNKYVSEADNGIFDAMNKGILMASGNYLLFLNAGDEFASCDVLENIESIIINDTCSHMLYSGDVAMYLNGLFVGLANLFPWIPHQGAVIKRELLLKYMFDQSMRVFGDLDLWMRLQHDGLFLYEKLDITVAKFCLGGVGNHPAEFLLRLTDKIKLAKKHRSLKVLLTACASLPIDLLKCAVCRDLNQDLQIKFNDIVYSIKKKFF